MLFGDDASVLHRVFEGGERCNCLGDALYHYRTRAGQITTAGFPPRKIDDSLRMYWEWLQYFSARPGREECYGLGRCAVLADFLPVLVPIRRGR